MAKKTPISTKKNKSALAKKTVKIKAVEKDAENIYEDAVSPLMPELEELVKKNPNRLIGCGG